MKHLGFRTILTTLLLTGPAVGLSQTTPVNPISINNPDKQTVDNLVTSDKEVKLSVPVLTNSLPVQVGSSLSSQYATEHTPDPAAGMLHLGTMTMEEGLRYPSLFGVLDSGNSIGEKVMPASKDGFPMMSPNNVYLTSWLTKQWAGVNLNLTQTHLIERPDDQLAVGISKAFFVVHNSLSINVGEHLVSDLENQYWSRTTDLSMDYGWKGWNFLMFVEQRQDLNLSEHSIRAAIKTKF